MEAKFTKGPWSVISRQIYVADGTRLVFNDQNAKLIAAAPEMYGLLKRLLDTCGFVNEIAETDALNLLTKINS